VADLVFAFDPAIDRPLAVPEDAPPAVAETIATAGGEAFRAAVQAARTAQAAALVLCGRILDPTRASPAQAAAVRESIVALAESGCRTVIVADTTAACHDYARMLGEPAGLCFVTPLVPLAIDVRGLPVELVSAHGPLPTAETLGIPDAPLHRRIVIGWDTSHWHAARWIEPGRDRGDSVPAMTAAAFAAAAESSPAWSHPSCFWVWGSRGHGLLPPGIHHLPALQARGPHEAAAGACCLLTLLDRDRSPTDGLPVTTRVDWRGSWTELATHRVAWRTLAVESATGGDEELATTIWAALEALPAQMDGPLEIVRCAVACGTSVTRRVRVAEIAAETLARVRQLFDARSFRIWCREIYADHGESLAPLGHARSGGRPGTTTSFASALADIVTAIEQTPGHAIPADLAREAGWLALELIEST
jgi:hypothetical protein